MHSAVSSPMLYCLLYRKRRLIKGASVCLLTPVLNMRHVGRRGENGSLSIARQNRSITLQGGELTGLQQNSRETGGLKEPLLQSIIKSLNLKTGLQQNSRGTGRLKEHLLQLIIKSSNPFCSHIFSHWIWKLGYRKIVGESGSAQRTPFAVDY